MIDDAHPHLRRHTLNPRPTVSVVIPVFNCERYVADAIQSVLTQTFPPFEVVVVDDGSVDGSASIVQGFGPPVQYVYQEHVEPGGAGHARNHGASLARGDLLAFLDADDLWLPEKLQRQVTALCAAPARTMVFGAAQQFISPELDDDAKARLACPTDAAPGMSSSSLLIRREQFLAVGPFETRWRLAEFVDWCARATDLGFATIMLPDVLVRRRLHTTNLGIRHRDAQSDYARVVKAALDRRRNRPSGRPADGTA